MHVLVQCILASSRMLTLGYCFGLVMTVISVSELAMFVISLSKSLPAFVKHVCLSVCREEALTVQPECLVEGEGMQAWAGLAGDRGVPLSSPLLVLQWTSGSSRGPWPLCQVNPLALFIGHMDLGFLGTLTA